VDFKEIIYQNKEAAAKIIINRQALEDADQGKLERIFERERKE
jgi:hypothetical protein